MTHTHSIQLTCSTWKILVTSLGVAMGFFLRYPTVATTHVQATKNRYFPDLEIQIIEVGESCWPLLMSYATSPSIRINRIYMDPKDYTEMRFLTQHW